MSARRSRSVLLALAAGLVGAAATAVFAPSPAAEAVATGEVLGTWNLKLRSDGWVGRVAEESGKDPSYAAGRDVGLAVMRLLPRDAQVNDGIVKVEITLDAATAKSLLGSATPGSPAFRGTAAMVGDSLAAIDSGAPNYVNAINLHFDRTRRKVTGTWFAVFPASEAALADQKFAAGVTAVVTGKRARRFDPRPVR